MSGIEARIADVLRLHPRAKGAAHPPFTCLGCGWTGRGHYEHVAEVLMAELGLTEEWRLLGKDARTGEPVAMPCSSRESAAVHQEIAPAWTLLESRYVTTWTGAL